MIILLEGLLKKIFGDPNEKELKEIGVIVDKINALEKDMVGLSSANLAAKTADFKVRLSKGETLDDILPEAFAVVREAAKRVLGMRHFDVQLIGGCVLHRGKIAEMRTGEGKTLVATLPAYLNALTGKGVHVVTVNEYLARRDSEDMGRVFKFLGLSVGLIAHALDYPDRKAAYAADITYGTNNEFGFDYLRDNMVVDEDQMVQRPLNYCIVDEVDSILIDEARTPLIISGPGEKSTDLYKVLAQVVAKMDEGEDYTVDEKLKTVAPTEIGIAKAEKMLGIENMYDTEHGVDFSHQLMCALKAKAIMHRDKDYVVKDGEVIIVDEFTGRLMFGRRFSEGLHQAIEAKEGVKVERESQTLATITFQNYFRMYEKLSGMTGTAKTEEQEFQKIYGLDVVVIPTNKPMVRIDYPDVILKTKRAKYKAAVNEIEECHKSGRPVLVGTTSIAQSEELSAMLKRRGIPHNVLNAKYHEKEAEIISGAGQYGAVTIATNMAGRGTDIVLGEGVPELGGLHIIGTERHESRRIDNQLRGRAGRQGDPGTSKFFLSLEDDLMRIFGSERMSVMLQRLGLPEGEALIHPWISKALEKAQQKVEERNFDIRKNLLKYDNVMNDQRKVIYEQRKELMEAEDVSETLQDMREEYLSDVICSFLPSHLTPSEWPVDELQQEILRITGFNFPIADWAKEPEMDAETMGRKIIETLENELKAKNAHIPENIMHLLQKNILLQVLDQLWKDHIATLDLMRHTIVLRAYGQKDPLIEYKKEAFNLFSNMLDQLREKTTFLMCRATIQTESAEAFQPQAQPARMQEIHEQPETLVGKQIPEADEAEKAEPFRYAQGAVDPKDPRTWGKVARNDLCPCGSGKKYKHCHGQIA